MQARVYNNVERPQQWLGLEPFDAVALGVVTWLLMLFYGHSLGWDALIVLCTWSGLRFLKRGRAPGYTAALVRFYVRRPFHSAAAPDVVGARHPFPLSTEELQS